MAVPEQPVDQLDRRATADASQAATPYAQGVPGRVPTAGRKWRWAGPPPWSIFLVAGLAISALYYAPFLGDGREVEYLLGEVSGLAIMVAALLFVRPARRFAWAMICVGMGLITLGDMTWDWLQFVQNVAPSPSAADVFYLAEYPFLLLGVALLVRGRPDRATVLDTLIITLGSGVLIWQVLVQPYIQDSTLSAIELGVAVAYPICDLALIAVVAGFAMTSGFGSPAFRLLGIGLVVTVVADLVYLELSLAGVTMDPLPLDFAYPLSMFLWAAAVLHPSAQKGWANDRRDWLRGRGQRLAVLGGSCLLVPVAIAIDLNTGDYADLPWIVAAWAILIVLVLLRIDAIVLQVYAGERRFRTIFEGSPAGIGIARGDVVLEQNEAVRLMFGYGDGVSIAATPVSQHVATRARDDFRARQEARPRGRPLGEAFETIGLRRDGTEFPLLVQARQIDLSDGPATLGFFLDLSEQRAAEEELRTSEERFRALVQHASDVIVMADVDSRARYVSPSAERMLRREPASLIDQLLTDLLHPEDAPAALAALADVAASVGSTAHAEWRLLRSDGSYCETETTISNMLDIAGVGGIVFTCRDIGERKELERQLTFQALHDPLTGLANRSLFNDRLEQALKRSRRSREEVAVLFIDLDDFKRINDSHGHAIGDSLLVEAGSRVRATLRAGDTAARLGGDEFAVLLEDLDDPATAHEVAERVAAVLQMPYALDGLEAFVTASVGIAVGRRGSIRGPELLRDADVAMYVAKAKGKRRCELFRPSMHEEVRDRLLLEAELRHAVERNEFEVYYQPVWATATRAMIGVEALVRWRHPERGIVAPAGFIAVAEETGLIVPIGSFVLHAACAQAVAWDQSGVTAGLSVAVNLSPRQLREPNLLPMIKGELTASGMAPERLNLEITESLLVDDDQVIVDLLDGLKSLGVRISIDDFGTGYSSLSYLRRLPVDTLKIAKSFVDVLSDGTRDEALAQAVIALARSLHLDVVAEGIEHEIQLQILTSMGCPMGQGYLVSPPLPAAQFAELAAESAKDAAA